MSFDKWKAKQPVTAPTVTGLKVNENPSKGNVTMNNSVASNALTGKITIANTEMAIIEYKGQRVVTLAMIDQVHGRAEGTAKRNFQTNKEHFVEGEDFYLIDFSQKNEFRTFGIEVPSRGLTVFTESGYLMLVKSFTDDLAWQVQRQLIKGYFKAKELLSNSQAIALPNFTDPAEAAIAWAAEFKAKQLAQVQVVQLEAENQAMRTDVQALEQISKADGILFAVAATPSNVPLLVIEPDIEAIFTMNVALTNVDPDSIEIVVDVNAPLAVVMMGQHLAAAHPHSQYKRTHDASERLKIADGQSNDEAVSKGQLDTEAMIRAGVDAALAGQIAQEVLDRQAGDSTEATARENGDLALTSDSAAIQELKFAVSNTVVQQVEIDLLDVRVC